jgi:hypothetical protein
MSDPKVGLDILNDNTPVDLTTVRTAMPVLKPSLHSAIIKKVELEPNKKNTGSNLVLEHTLVNQVEADDGKVINPGFTVFDLISLVKTFKDDGETVNYNPVEKLVAVIEAVTGEKSGSLTPREMVSLIQSFVGRQIAFRTVIENDEKFGAKTRIARYVKSA